MITPLLLAILFAPLDVCGLSQNKLISQFSEDTWRIADGLPELTIQHILQSSDGYLWVGTQEGLTRFDGKTFAVFDHTNTPALRSDFISCLVEDNQHSLWIGTREGIVKRTEHGEFTSFGKAEHSPLAFVISSTRAADGSVWIGGFGGLVHIVDGKVERSYDSHDGLDNDLVTSIAIDNSGALWVLARGTLFLLRDGKLDNVSNWKGLSGSSPMWLFTSSAGELWILSKKGVIYRKVDDHFESWWPRDVPQTIRVRDIHEDHEGSVWIATEAGGLYRSRPNATGDIPAEHALNDIGLLSLFEDTNGSLWLGTYGRGLIRLRDGAFTTYTKRDGLSSSSVFSVTQDHAGSIWVGSLNGLSRITANGIKTYSRETGLTSEYIASLYASDDGGLWIGAPSTTVSHMTNEKVDRTIVLNPASGSSVVPTLFEDKEHTLWIGTDGGGLAKYAHGQLNYISRSPELSENFISAITQDAAGTIWVGTNHGIARVQGDSLTFQPVQNADMTQDSIIELHADNENNVWVGTLGHGLFRINNRDVTHIKGGPALTESTVDSILSTESDLWIGTNRGVLKITLAQIREFLQGQRSEVSPILFGEADGMRTAETTSGAQSSAWAARDGRLWFATTEGVTVVDPNHLDRNSRPLTPSVESIRVDDALFASGNGTVDIAANTSHLDIDFSAPDLVSGSTTQFRYRLTGVNDRWTDVGNERVARYFHVPAGRHTFEVQAKRANEDWGSIVAGVSFNVMPVFYKTKWFLLLVLMASVIFLWLAHYLRIQWITMQSAVSDERRRMAGEIHDNLAQGFTAVAMQIEVGLGRMLKAPQLAVEHFKLARDTAITSLSEARRSVWNLRSSLVSPNSLAHSIRSLGEQLTHGSGSELSFDISGKQWAANPIIEHTLTRVAQESISNALQHGKASNLKIELSYSLTRLLMRVSDDGTGFDVDKIKCVSGRGFGLENMAHRTKSIKGTFDIHSSPGVGTQIETRVPRFTFYRTQRPRALRARNGANDDA